MTYNHNVYLNKIDVAIEKRIHDPIEVVTGPCALLSRCPALHLEVYDGQQK